MASKKPKSELALAREGKVGKLSIVGDIGWDWFGVSYKGFKDKLAGIGKVDLLEVDITSNGGVVTDGVAIMNLLREQDVPVHVYINGVAASIATVIAMAGDRIFIPDNSMFFMHKPLNILRGNAEEMRKMADDLDKFEKAIVNAYKRHFKGDEQEIKDIMAADTWMTGDEVADKFSNVTVIVSGEAKAAAHGDPLEILGDVGIPQESILDKAVNAVRNRVTKVDTIDKEVEMTPEEVKALADKAASDAVAAYKKELADAEAKAKADADAKAKAAAVVGVEIPFEGDMENIEDVKAHQAKVELAQLKAAVNWSDIESIEAYHGALAKRQGKTAKKQPGTNATAHESALGNDQEGFSDDEINAAVARMTKNSK